MHKLQRLACATVALPLLRHINTMATTTANKPTNPVYTNSNDNDDSPSSHTPISTVTSAVKRRSHTREEGQAQSTLVSNEALSSEEEELETAVSNIRSRKNAINQTVLTSLNGNLVEPLGNKYHGKKETLTSSSEPELQEEEEIIEFDLDHMEIVGNVNNDSDRIIESKSSNGNKDVNSLQELPSLDDDDDYGSEESSPDKVWKEVQQTDLWSDGGIVFTDSLLDEEFTHKPKSKHHKKGKTTPLSSKQKTQQNKLSENNDRQMLEEEEENERDDEELEEELEEEEEEEEEEAAGEAASEEPSTQYELSMLKTDKELFKEKQEAMIANLYDNNDSDTTSSNDKSILPNLDNDGTDSLGFDLNAAHSLGSDREGQFMSNSLNNNINNGLHETFVEGDKESKNVNERLLSAIDMLCDDLFYCKRDVLINFARTRGLCQTSKSEIVFRLISIAHEEAHGESKDLTATKRLLGDVFNEDVRTSGLRSAWTNKSLEASHIEQACERHLGFEAMTNAFVGVMVRRNVAESTRILRRLSRPFQSEYEKIANSAVGGMYRSYKAELDVLVQRYSVAEIVSPFASFLVSYIRYGATIHLITRINVNEKLVQLGLVAPAIEEDEVVHYSTSTGATLTRSTSSFMSHNDTTNSNSNIHDNEEDSRNNDIKVNEEVNQSVGGSNTTHTVISPTLQELMSLLEETTSEVESQLANDELNNTRGTQERPELLAVRAIHFAEHSHTHWNTELAPHWVHELARMFNNWEVIVRNDVPLLNDVPRSFFDSILVGVTNSYVLQKVYSEIYQHTDVITPLRNAPRFILRKHFNGDEEKVMHALRSLVTYVQTLSYENKSVIRPDFFAAVLSQMQGAVGEAEHNALHCERVAVILKESTYIATRCTRSAGLAQLLVLITNTLHFHFRFLQLFKKMNAIDRSTVRLRKSLNMNKTATYFEKEFNMNPPSVKSIAFLSIILLYLSMRGSANKSASRLLMNNNSSGNNNNLESSNTSSDGRQPIVQRFASVLQKPELSILGLTDPGFTKVRDLQIAFPPQLSYNSWLNESDTREKSIYNVLPSVAVKGATNQAMLISQAPMMKALDAISRVPWRINKYMLHVQEAMVREGFEFGKIKAAFYPLRFTEMSSGDIHFPVRKANPSTGNNHNVKNTSRLADKLTRINPSAALTNYENENEEESTDTSSVPNEQNDEVDNDGNASIKTVKDKQNAITSKNNKNSKDKKDGIETGESFTNLFNNDYEDDYDADISEDGNLIFNLRQKWEHVAQLNKDWKDMSDVRSTRIHYLQALRQARSIVQFSHLYFPNSMDFRGRMYPLPGRLNHTGSDPFRALLEYAEPKPLGDIGLYWLKVHLANKFGMSKLSFDERVHFVDEHVEDVIQSAESPLHGDKWWQEASEPLQCLMACKELADALKCSQGSANFLSRLPVAVDGSYNGLQHYSAIGRDELGAALVNLVPSERPADAYTGILKEMMKSIELDAQRDHQVAQRCIGTGKGQDKNHIKRKTIKRPIMTQVYGVTAFGMTEQIKSQLEKQNKGHGLWTSTDIKEMAAYIRDKLLESLGITFRETQNCRKWIRTVSTMVWEVQPPELRNALCWTTPLGLVVRQPYRQHKEVPLFTREGLTRIPGDAVAPASKKQLSAIAPNLIHSLDATHLAMTALEMQHRGLSMMAVHDSYWTYACDLPALSHILRQQFVALYSKYDPLWELKEQWEEAYFMDLRRHGVRLPDPPQRGKLDINTVINSPYFFS